MSEFGASEKTMEVARDTLKMCEEKCLSVREVLDLPRAIEGLTRQVIRALHEREFENPKD